MTNTINDGGTDRVGFSGWLRRKGLPLAILIFVIAIVGAIACLYWFYPGLLKRLEGYGYLGAFVISIILNATIILPVSNMAVLMALGAALPVPALVGLVGGLGAAIGELTGYVAGRSGRELIARSRMYSRIERWVQRWGWLAVFVLSVVPFVFDVVGIAAGAMRMPLWKFFIACWLGRTVLYVAMVCAAAYGLKILVPWLG